MFHLHPEEDGAGGSRFLEMLVTVRVHSITSQKTESSEVVFVVAVP